MLEEIEKIEKISSAETPNKKIEKPQTEPNKDYFDALLAQEKTHVSPSTAALSIENVSNKPTLIDQIRDLTLQVEGASRKTPQDLIAQSQEMISQLGELKKKLATPNLELTTPIQNVLQNKLVHIEDSLQVALTRAGIEYKPAEMTPTKVNPIERFLGFLTDAQHQLGRLGTEVEGIHLQKGEISPASMLVMQIKVGYIQQEIEFATAALNKFLEAMKTIGNIQV